MKRSNEPVFWSLFGAGGMLAALTGVALVFITGLGVPLGLVSAELMSYANLLAFAQHWVGKLIVFAVVTLFLWHAMLRILLLLHDFGIRAGPATALLGNGLALLCTLAAACLLLTLGF